MKRSLSLPLAGLLVGVVALGTGPLAAHAVVRHQGGAPTQYYESVIYPQGQSISHGSMATVPDINGTKVKFYDGYLQPEQIYNEYVRTGACGTMGRTIVNLGRNQADPDGSLNFVTTLNPSVLSSNASLHVDVSQDMAGAPVVACGAIHAAQIVLHLHSVSNNYINSGGGVALFNFGVRGNEVLYHTPNAIGSNVVIYAQGLEPSTLHEEHIHNGQCIPDQNNQVRYDLYYMETDPNGEGVSGTFFNGRINLANSYVQVHAANLQSAACADLGGNGLPR